ncbi:MAG: ribonuclease HII [Candidatus Paceibacteria bacterium]
MPKLRKSKFNKNLKTARILPNLKEERNLWKNGHRYVVGVDEVGRGALAGPVVAAAVAIADPKNLLKNLPSIKIRDSKRLNQKQRQAIYGWIVKNRSLLYSTSRVSARTIDRLNVRQATLLSMLRAVKKLKCKPSIILIDGIDRLKTKTPQYTYIKGDTRIFSIALASILAKVVRDGIMERAAKKYPEYGFEIHKGYATKEHLRKIKKLGALSIHRKTFL